ncbi:hypothetical protein DPMN_090037 [Dreissena polymorpha]|uniref:Craniofacial development protein 2-like n=1 Tax=Dreissena polymorpha TaxID=45954 RepID=A0A9D4KZD9_DREPO|nr:hypothetical protein DPMN_090037 [Dreissena polymorpha]
MGDFNAKIGSRNRGYEEIMWKQGFVTRSSEEVFSFTEGKIRQLGCHQTCQRRTRLTTCASQGSFVALFRMNVSIDEQTWLRTIISSSPD